MTLIELRQLDSWSPNYRRGMDITLDLISAFVTVRRLHEHPLDSLDRLIFSELAQFLWPLARSIIFKLISLSVRSSLINIGVVGTCCCRRINWQFGTSLIKCEVRRLRLPARHTLEGWKVDTRLREFASHGQRGGRKGNSRSQGITISKEMNCKMIGNVIQFHICLIQNTAFIRSPLFWFWFKVS